MYIFLKSKKGETFKDRRFALLIEPGNNKGYIDSDDELYRAIRRNGRAIIQNIVNLEVVGDPITLTPEEFEETWIGD